MTSPSNNEDKDAWLLKIELKREEPEEINKDERIKKAMEVQAPVDHIAGLKGIIRKLEELLRSMCYYPPSSSPPLSPPRA